MFLFVVIEDGLDHLLLVLLTEAVIKREAKKSITDVFGNGTVSGMGVVSTAHFREMERQVMENSENSSSLEVGDKLLAFLQ